MPAAFCLRQLHLLLHICIDAWRVGWCLQEELEVLAQKKAAAVRAEKTAGQLRKDVRLLQEALADNNIIIDKVKVTIKLCARPFCEVARQQQRM